MKIALLGDIALFGKMSVTENPKVSDYFAEVAGYLGKFDYVVGNLETPFSVEKKSHGAKSAYICSDVVNIETLKQLHINAVTLANNHMFDFGTEGYETTKTVLEEAGIEFFGTEGIELKKEICGKKLAFSGYCCYSSNPLQCVPAGDFGVNAYNLQQVADTIKRNHDEGFLNIVAVHAGLEHVNYPSIDHITAARMLADVCPYVYYGHHPHVIQGVEKHGGSLIAHSLGNFCFDDVYSTVSSKTPLITLTENNRTGMILELTIEDNEIIGWHEQLIYIGKDGIVLIQDHPNILEDYNNALSHCDGEDYTNMRNEILAKHISERKAMRNMQWYFKRLRPKYVKLMFDNKKNIKLYNNNIKKYIENGL